MEDIFNLLPILLLFLFFLLVLCSEVWTWQLQNSNPAVSIIIIELMTYLLVYVFTFTLHKCRCIVFYFDLLSFFKELILFLNFTKSTLNVQRIQIIEFLTNFPPPPIIYDLYATKCLHLNLLNGIFLFANNIWCTILISKNTLEHHVEEKSLISALVGLSLTMSLNNLYLIFQSNQQHLQLCNSVHSLLFWCLFVSLTTSNALWLTDSHH